MTAHAQLLAKAKQGRIDVYFEGDSITRRWGATDYPDFLAHWTRNFFGWNAADFGWGADRLSNILWRLQNGELDGVHPKVIVLQGGTNDVGAWTPGPDGDERADDVIRGLQAVIGLMRAKAPSATIVVTGLFPRNDNLAYMPVIRRINAALGHLADGRSLRFVDISSAIAGPDGVLFEGMMNPDKLHPTVKTYQAWADALKPIFTELLGPPAAVDQAPPPTGDPKAAVRR